jgi:hypothetical protein
MAATDFVTESQVDSLVTNIATAVKANATAVATKANTSALTAHTGAAAAAHAASAVSVADAALQLAATDVETALAEIMDYAQTKTDDAVANAHIVDTSAAHAASAISVLDVAAKYTATDVEAALAEVKTIADAAAGGGVVINDAATNGTQAWSSNKITTHVSTSVAALVAGSPAALDTLNELAAALGSDANFATTMTTALGFRLRFDAAQTLTAPQKVQALANLGIVASVVNFAANFNTAIA